MRAVTGLVEAEERSDGTLMPCCGSPGGGRGFTDPPPLKWSALRYGFRAKEDHDAEEVRSIGVTEVTYYRWRQEFGGLKSDQVKRLKALETENTRLRRAIADLTLDKLILQEAARGNF